VVIALFLFLSGMVFGYGTLQPGGGASLRDFFENCWSLLVVVAPAISMRLLSEEIRTGTVEPLLTSPVAEFSVVLGKYLGAVGFFITALLPTLVYPALLLHLSSPDAGPMLTGYLGLVLLGMLYLAVGTLLSAVTSSQTLAFLSTLFVLAVVEVGARQAARVLQDHPPWDQMALGLSPGLRVADFAKGVIDTGHVVFFVSSIAWLLTVGSLLLRMRRWR
jgi:ABC-2 type transport system permease protein